VDPSTRTAIVAGAVSFVVFFLFMTVAVAFQTSFDLFTIAALLIVALIGAGLIGALRNPPDD
jgi:small neutral amino acid transporter SnatA (MarC family)